MSDYQIAMNHSFAPECDCQQIIGHSHSVIHHSCIVNLHVVVPIPYYPSVIFVASASNHDFPCEACLCGFQALNSPHANPDYLQAMSHFPVVPLHFLLLPFALLLLLFAFLMQYHLIPVSLQKPLLQAVQSPKLFYISGYLILLLPSPVLSFQILAPTNASHVYPFATIPHHIAP